MELKYKFEKMSNGMYQVRMCDDLFVCYSSNKNEKEVDEFLKREGYESRQAYFDEYLKDIKNYL